MKCMIDISRKKDNICQISLKNIHIKKMRYKPRLINYSSFIYEYNKDGILISRVEGVNTNSVYGESVQYCSNYFIHIDNTSEHCIDLIGRSVK